jgi:hypothetical protein
VVFVVLSITIPLVPPVAVKLAFTGGWVRSKVPVGIM